MKIFKYRLELEAFQTIKMKGVIQILDVINQDGILQLYALVDPTETYEVGVDVAIVGTGHDASDELERWTFLRSVKQKVFVWHIFYKVDI